MRFIARNLPIPAATEEFSLREQGRSARGSLGGRIAGFKRQLVGGFSFWTRKQPLEIFRPFFAVGFQTASNKHFAYLRKGPPLPSCNIFQFFLQVAREPKSNLLVFGWHMHVEF